MVGKLPVTLGVAAGVLVLDQVTKAIAVAQLEGRPPVPVLGELLQLHFVRNPGAAFSLGGNYTIIISVLALTVTFFIVRTARTLTSVWWAVVLGGVLGGALGNLIDRMFRSPGPLRGHVVDFLALPSWPVFNVADMSLVGAAILAVGLSLFGVELTDEPDGSDGSEGAAGVAQDPPGAGEEPNHAPEGSAPAAEGTAEGGPQPERGLEARDV